MEHFDVTKNPKRSSNSADLYTLSKGGDVEVAFCPTDCVVASDAFGDGNASFYAHHGAAVPAPPASARARARVSIWSKEKLFKGQQVVAAFFGVKWVAPQVGALPALTVVGCERGPRLADFFHRGTLSIFEGIPKVRVFQSG